MGDLVELRNRPRKAVTPKADAFASSAATFVLIPSERFSDLRQFWIDLKADIAAESDENPQHLIRR